MEARDQRLFVGMDSRVLIRAAATVQLRSQKIHVFLMFHL